MGDPAFDRQVFVAGNQEEVLALLDHETRKGVLAVLHLTEHPGNRIDRDGVLVTEQGAVDDPDRIVEIVRAMLSLGQRLHRPGTVGELLRDNATADPDPRVRKRNLEMLLTTYGSHHTAREAAVRSLEDPDVGIRLRGARFLGPGGRDALRVILGDQQVANPHRHEAMKQLLAVDSDDVAALLIRHLDDADPYLRLLALKGLNRRGTPVSLSQLLPLLENPNPFQAAEVARALERCGEPGAEAALLGLLKATPVQVRLAAIRSLGRIGTVRAVEPLANRIRTAPLFDPIKKEAREAIEAIRARLPEADAGRLSLVEDAQEGGELSLAPEPGGLALEGESPEDQSDGAAN